MERRQLDAEQPAALPVWGPLDATRFVRVEGLAAFWQAVEDCRYEQYMEDLIAGCHGLMQTFAYLVLGRGNTVQVHVGLQGLQADAILETALRGAFPAIELAERPVERLGSELNATPLFNHLGRLTGVPTLKAGQTKDQIGTVQQIERLLRGMYGEQWGYLVLGRPVESTQVAHMAAGLFQRVYELSPMVKKNVPIASNVTAEQVDRQAQYCVELLEKQLERLNRGKAQGMWQTDVHLFAATETGLDRARALCNAVFAGEDSTPEPVRTFKCVSAAPPTGAHQFATLLNSHELAVLVQLPREEMPGYAVRDYARFDVALPSPMPTGAGEVINIGGVMDGATPTGNTFAIQRADFAKHGLVVGVTGSGKTNTLFYLLNQLWDEGRGVPFMVIEPAKAEYRDLRTVPGFEKLRVFTLGDERWAPFRLNPFEFEIGDAENRVHVQTHIDYLKSVFNAAFVLYAPMPYVLETCLHEIYQDKGWDLTTSQNRRLPPQERGNEACWPVFPTLADLYRKIDEVVDRLGYEERIQMDVKAGLKTRIGSLRLGGKGLMLDVRHSVPMKELLSQPTVLELERIGNDDEKAFLIGLLLTRLYEFRVVQARAGSAKGDLQHVAVVEEAHRLLKNVSTEVGTEEANVKGQAVESFANMLSEIRAYGQGVLIAEQIPSKLAPDAVKNTNLKVLHRVVAQDDRDMMGGTMNLDDRQKRFVTSLRTGQAVVYAEGADRPYLVEVFPFKKKNVKRRVADRQVRGAMQEFCNQPVYEPLLGYNQYIQSLLPADGRGNSDVRDLALAVLLADEFAAMFSRYFLSLVLEPLQGVYGYNALVKLAEQVVKPRPDQQKPVALYVMLQAVTDLLDDKGRRYNWLYNVVETLRRDLTTTLADVVATFVNRQDAIDALAGRHGPALGIFAKQYRQLCSKAPIPYAGCAFCSDQCLYRYEIAPLAHDKALIREFGETIRTVKSDDAMWHGLASLSQEAAMRAVQADPPMPVPTAAVAAVAVCFAAQMAVALELSSASQRKLVKNIKEILSQPRKESIP
jgi:hypothetical protein